AQIRQPIPLSYLAAQVAPGLEHKRGWEAHRGHQTKRLNPAVWPGITPMAIRSLAITLQPSQNFGRQDLLRSQLIRIQTARHHWVESTRRDQSNQEQLPPITHSGLLQPH